MRCLCVVTDCCCRLLLLVPTSPSLVVAMAVVALRSKLGLMLLLQLIEGMLCRLVAVAKDGHRVLFCICIWQRLSLCPVQVLAARGLM